MPNPETMTLEQFTVLADIADVPFYDDANGSRELSKVRRWLFRHGYIDGIPIAGSDANVEQLFVTKKGRAALLKGIYQWPKEQDAD